MTQQDLYYYMHKFIDGVISTCGKNGQPESAVVGLGQTDKLEIIFGTNHSTRKYKNIIENPHVSFVLWEENTTMQYEGVATELFGEEKQRLIEIFHTKVPSAAHFKNQQGQVYFKITPTWIRFTDYKNKTSPVQEFLFSSGQLIPFTSAP